MEADLSNESIITATLEMLGATVGGTKRGYVEASCPLAQWRHGGGVDNNPSFGVVYSPADAKKETGHAHCFSCGYSGDIREIASLMHVWGGLTLDELSNVMVETEQLKTGGLPLSLSTQVVDDPFPDPEWLESFPPITKQHKDAVAYLDQRGIAGKTVKNFDVRFDAGKYRVSVPLYDRAHRFRGLIGRTLIKDPMGPRYFYYPYKGHAPRGFTWFNEANLDLSKPVLVVEGIFDAFKVWPVYQNVTAALSVSFRNPGMGWHTRVARWVTMFDMGKGGMLGRARAQTNLKAPGSQMWHLEPPPGRSDPGEATPDEIKAQLDTLSVAKPFGGI